MVAFISASPKTESELRAQLAADQIAFKRDIAKGEKLLRQNRKNQKSALRLMVMLRRKGQLQKLEQFAEIHGTMVIAEIQLAESIGAAREMLEIVQSDIALLDQHKIALENLR